MSPGEEVLGGAEISLGEELRDAEMSEVVNSKYWYVIWLLNKII